MFIARIKYSQQAIPKEKEFSSIEDAQTYCENKEKNNPYVRWTEVEGRSGLIYPGVAIKPV